MKRGASQRRGALICFLARRANATVGHPKRFQRIRAPKRGVPPVFIRILLILKVLSSISGAFKVPFAGDLGHS